VTRKHTPGARIAFASRGDRGPPVLFLPGSYSTEAAWRGIWSHLPEDWRLAATSLCGCGDTAETRSPDDADMAHELAVVANATHRLGGGPVHLVGHSFGGTVALATALSREIEVTSLALFEANPFGLLADQPALLDEAATLAAAFTDALGRGEADAAARIIDYWGGEGCFAAMPPKVQDFCRQTAPANALDWETCLAFRPDPAALRALDIPVLLVRGEAAIPVMVAMTAKLGALLPRVSPVVVRGAGHFLISTHPSDCAALLTEHLAQVAAAPALQGETTP